MAETHLLILWKSIRLSWFRVTDHIHSFDLHRDVLPTDSDFDRGPLALILKRPVKITHMKKGTALDSPVDRTTMEKHLITTSRAVVVKSDTCRSARLCLEFTTQYEVGVIALELVAGSFSDGEFLPSAGKKC